MSTQPSPPHTQADLARLRTEYHSRDSSAVYRAEYSAFNLTYFFVIQQRQRAMLDALRRQGITSLADLRILDVGCGYGAILQDWLAFGANAALLCGLDLLANRIQQARKRLPYVALACGDAQNLPFASDTFDVVSQFTVFSSILDTALRCRIADEMVRVVRKPNGFILWYDFWVNPTNPQTCGINAREIRRLFPGCQLLLTRVTLAPPITRRLVRMSWIVCVLLERLRLMNSHYMAIIRPRG